MPRVRSADPPMPAQDPPPMFVLGRPARPKVDRSTFAVEGLVTERRREVATPHPHNLRNAPQCAGPHYQSGLRSGCCCFPRRLLTHKRRAVLAAGFPGFACGRWAAGAPRARSRVTVTPKAAEAGLGRWKCGLGVVCGLQGCRAREGFSLGEPPQRFRAVRFRGGRGGESRGSRPCGRA